MRDVNFHFGSMLLALLYSVGQSYSAEEDVEYSLGVCATAFLISVNIPRIRDSCIFEPGVEKPAVALSLHLQGQWSAFRLKRKERTDY